MIPPVVTRLQCWLLQITVLRDFNLLNYDKWEPIKSQVRVSWVISCHLPGPGQGWCQGATPQHADLHMIRKGIQLFQEFQ